jgi:hypothetical protein
VGMATMNGDVEWLQGEVFAEPLQPEEIALSDQANFLSGLTHLGLSDSAVAEARSLLTQVESATVAIDDFKRVHGDAYFVTPPELERLYKEQESRKQRFFNWVSRRTIQVERTQELVEKVPVFLLSAPDVSGCSVSFSLNDQLMRNLDCKLAVYGSGLSVGSKWSCRARCQFGAQAGEAKLVFVLAEITVGDVAILEKGKKVGQGRQITAVEYKANSEPGATLVPSHSIYQSGSLAMTYPLLGDSSASISKYDYDYAQANTVGFTLGLKAFGADVGLTVDVTLEREIGLTYNLIGGYDYHLHNLTTGQGISWKSDRATK